MRKHLWMLLGLPFLAACAETQEEQKPQVQVAKEDASIGPLIQYYVERTGLELQPDRGSRVGDALLGGKMVIQRVIDNNTLGVYHATFQVKSQSSDPLYGAYRIVFYDDWNQPVGPFFSRWEALAIAEPFGAADLHAACSQRGAVYFVLEAKGGAVKVEDVKLPAEAKSAEVKPAEEKPAEAKPAEAKPAEEKPAEAKPAEAKPADPKPAEEKPAEAKPADPKPAEEKPAEAKPADPKPAEEKPPEAKPADPKPAEEKPAEPMKEKPAEEKKPDAPPNQ